MSKIIQNAVKITEDGKVTYLISTHRHHFDRYDFKTGESIAVDGGQNYIKRSISQYLKGENIENYNLNDDFPFDIIATKLLWGHYKKDGTGPLKYSPFAELTLDHLKAILDYNDKLAIGLSELQIKVINHWITEKSK